MNPIWNSAAALLLVTGGLLGLTFPLGKIATAAGVSPVVWSFLISFGVGTVLIAVLALRSGLPRLDAHKLRFYLVAGVVSYAAPNILVFASIPHLGAGFTAIMLTLSPVFTLSLSMALKLRRPNLLGIGGIAVGFVGAVIVAATRGEVGAPAALSWVGLGLLIPVCLALGNIYRTIDWPPGAGPIELAIGSHYAAAAVLFVIGLLPFVRFDVTLVAEVPLAALAQVASSAAMFAFFFRLQAVGGPVYLSQIGYVAAAVGLVSGTIFLGERYALLTWAGALIIGLGVAMTTRAQQAER